LETDIMPRRILIINGHPENNPSRLCWALAEAYSDGARSAGHYVRRIDLATIDIPLKRISRREKSLTSINRRRRLWNGPSIWSLSSRFGSELCRPH